MEIREYREFNGGPCTNLVGWILYPDRVKKHKLDYSSKNK